MSSPTVRSLALLRKEGFLAEVVERFNHYAGPPDKKCPQCGKNKVGVRHDLFRFADIIGVDPATRTVLLVQTTSGSNLSARRRKLGGIGEVLVCMSAGMKVEIHGWVKRASGRYEVIREKLN